MKLLPEALRTSTAVAGALIGLTAVPALAQVTNCTPPPPGLVSWWRAEGDAKDSAGTNDGVLLGGVSFTPSEVGQGFYYSSLHNEVLVPASTTLDVGLASGMTLEAWINPADMVSHPVFEWSFDGAYGVHFWASHPSPGMVYANLIDISGGGHIIQSLPGLLVSNAFQHVAVTYDKASGEARLYLNGSVVAAANLGTFTPLTYTNLEIGYRLPGAPFGEHSFNGIIDEPSIYNRALGTNEIQAIYNAGTAGKCFTSNSPPIAENVFVKVLENEVFNIPAYRFLLFCSDPDNDQLVISSVSPVSTNGTSVTLGADGVLYAAQTNYLGDDRFDYTITDGHGNTASASALVLVEPRQFASATILQPLVSGGTVQLHFNGLAGRTYTIERAESLNGPWTTLGTVGTDNSGSANFVDPNPPAVNAYYRAVFQ